MDSTERFTGRAADYASARPSYPQAAIDALFDGLNDPRGLTVVDLGAGTGISSRLLAARGARVLALEPNATMRATAEPASNVEWRDATAEVTCLGDATADLVVAFQAFHWFDHPTVLREIARILKPAGRAAVVYNERDESDPFTAVFSELVRRYATDETETLRRNARAAFATWPTWAGVHAVEFSYAQRLDRAGLHARVNSTSYLPREGSAADELHQKLDGIFDDWMRDDSVTLRLVTSVAYAHLAQLERVER